MLHGERLLIAYTLTAEVDRTYISSIIFITPYTHKRHNINQSIKKFSGTVLKTVR